MSYGPPMANGGPTPYVGQGTPFSAYPMAGPSETVMKEPLTIVETLQLHVEYGVQGFWDALNFKQAITFIQEDPEIQGNVVKAAILNGLSIASVVAFDYLILPLLDPKNDKWFHRHFEALYQGFWLLPLVAISLYLNVYWCSLIANRTFSLRHGRKAVNATPYTGMVALIASSAYRVILIASYLTLGFLLTYVRYLGTVLSFIYICWVNSYYCFEYLWIARGMTLSTRVKHEEERWAYFFAFGFPSAFACMWGSSLANAAIFALLLPYFIIQAMHANPVPTNPYSPTSAASVSSGFAPVNENNNAPPTSPHHAIPVRLPIFRPVILVNDGLVRLLSVTGTSRATKRSLGLNALVSDGEGAILGEDAPTVVTSPSTSYGYASPTSSTAPLGGGGPPGAIHRVRRRKAD